MKIEYLDLFKEVAKTLTTTFHIPVHSDEVLEGFSMPCFFIKLLPISSVETINVMQVKMSIMITYLTNRRDQITYLGVFDKIRDTFDVGFPVGDRYVHIEQIQDTRTGEKDDILQIEMDITYFNKTKNLQDRIDHDTDANNVIEDVEYSITNTKSEDIGG